VNFIVLEVVLAVAQEMDDQEVDLRKVGLQMVEGQVLSKKLVSLTANA